jgi:hypothetical protein
VGQLTSIVASTLLNFLFFIGVLAPLLDIPVVYWKAAVICLSFELFNRYMVIPVLSKEMGR